MRDYLAKYSACFLLNVATTSKPPLPTSRRKLTTRTQETKTSQQKIADKRPQNANKWGREGEKMNPDMPPQQQQQQQQTNFQHRGGAGLQIPYQNTDPRYYGYGYPQQPYGYPPPNGYGYPQMPPNYPQGSIY